MTFLAVFAAFFLGVAIGALSQRRSDAVKDAHMRAEIHRLGKAIAESLK